MLKDLLTYEDLVGISISLLATSATLLVLLLDNMDIIFSSEFDENSGCDVHDFDGWVEMYEYMLVDRGNGATNRWVAMTKMSKACMNKGCGEAHTRWERVGAMRTSAEGAMHELSEYLRE
jgi:hypothetical protein